MCGLVLNPAVLCLLVWIVARSTAEFDYGRMFFIALGVGLAGALMSIFIPAPFDLITLLPLGALLVFLLIKYCYLTLTQSLIVMGAYFAYQVLFGLLMYLAFSK
jgi:hypothetical protein